MLSGGDGFEAWRSQSTFEALMDQFEADDNLWVGIVESSHPNFPFSVFVFFLFFLFCFLLFFSV